MLFLKIPLTGCELCWLPTEKFTSVYFSCIGRDIGTAPIGRDNNNPRYLDCLDNFGPSHQMNFYIMSLLKIPFTGCELCWLPTEKFTSVYFSCIGRDIGTAPFVSDNINIDILTASIILDPATK